MLKVKDDIFYVGVDDNITDLFEGMYPIKNGISYNSYVLMDEKVVVFDTVCGVCKGDFDEQWLKNLKNVLGKRTPDYLIISHMEPDHSSVLDRFVSKYPGAKVIGNKKTFSLVDRYFPGLKMERQEVAEGDTICTGKHTLRFIMAPMVHWPEVMMTYDETAKILYSADAFGKFGVLSSNEGWLSEARRYYMGIVGKFGANVQALFKKLPLDEIGTICPLHGPVLTDTAKKCIERYKVWSSYKAETQGVFIGFSSIYGNTEVAASMLKTNLVQKGVKVGFYDLARVDKYECVAQAFRYSVIVLCAPTYNGDIFPATREFIYALVERNLQNKAVGFIENGSWAPMSAKGMRAKLEPCKNIKYLEPVVTVPSVLDETSINQIDKLATACMENIGVE